MLGVPVQAAPAVRVEDVVEVASFDVENLQHQNDDVQQSDPQIQTFIGADPHQHYSMTQRLPRNSGYVIPMIFCPNCGMLLKYELPNMAHPARFVCPTCPYVSQIKSKVKIKQKLRLVKKVVDPIVSKDDTSNEPKTDHGGPSHVVNLEVQGDVYTGGGDDNVEFHPESTLFDSDTNLNPLVIPCTGPCSLVISISSSSKKSLGSPEKDSVKKVVFSESGKSPNATNKTRAYQKLVGTVSELGTSWYDRKEKREARLRDRVSRYRLRITVQAAKKTKLLKKIRKLKKLQLQKMILDMRKEAIHKVVEHTKVVEVLKKELQDVRAASEEKLKQTSDQIKLKRKMVEKLNGELELEKDARRQERVSLEKSLERASSDRQWLIKEGFGYVINRLHRSSEYLEPLATVQLKLWESGAHYGLVEGYASCNDGGLLKDVSLYNPEAHEKFLKAVHELEHTRFPYVVALSQCADCPLDDLKALEPIVMDEDDGAVAGDSGQ